MNSSKSSKIVVVILSATTIICLAFLIKFYWQTYWFGGWKDQTFMYSSSDGARQALDDFQSGRLRLYELDGDRDDAKFSGRRDGSFEIWYMWYHPSLGIAEQYAMSNWVAYYNMKMKYMYAHPEKFSQESNTATNILVKPAAH
jgi:hypothetical protein